MKPNFFIFSLFIIFLHFLFLIFFIFHFFSFFFFSDFSFHFFISFIFIFFVFLHFLSFYSCSLFFCHFLSFSIMCFLFSFSCFFFFFFFFLFLFFFFFFFFFLLGAQNLIFLGINFVTISLNISLKKTFFGPSRRVQQPFQAFFSFFFLLFFPPVLFLGSCSSFLFSASFENVFLYLFFSFPAFVSGRCRCSMEIWCLDDIGRDSWDWVGPPAWERA